MWSVLARRSAAALHCVPLAPGARCVCTAPPLSAGRRRRHRRTDTGKDDEPSKRAPPRRQSDTFGSLTSGASPLRAAALRRADSFAYWHDERQRRVTDRKLQKSRTELADSLQGEDETEYVDFRSKHAQSQQWYLERCEQLLADGKLAESVALLARRMIELDKVMPEQRIFNVNLKALAAAGHARDAFKLFKQMVTMGVRPSAATYTTMLNACANSRQRRAAVQTAERLLDTMREIGKPPARLHCHAAIKVFARHNEWDKACRVYRLMLDSAVRVDAQTFAHLLLAAKADRRRGYIKMLAVLRAAFKLQSDRRQTIPFSEEMVNVLLSVCRRCGAEVDAAGEPLSAYQTDLGIAGPLGDYRAPTGRGKRRRSAPAGVDLPAAPLRQIAESALFATPDEAAAPDRSTEVTDYDASKLRTLLLPVAAGGGKRSQRLPLTAFDEGWNAAAADVFQRAAGDAWGRFSLLFGDFAGFADFLALQRVSLNARNLTQLVGVLPAPAGATPAQVAAQYETLVERCGVVVDTTFCNALVDTLCIRAHKYDEAKALLSHLTRRYQVPADDHSWRMLAMTCTWWPPAKELLQQMESLGVVPNVFVYGVLVGNALHCKLDGGAPRHRPAFKYRPDWQFALNVLYNMRKNGVKPTVGFTRVVDRKLSRAHKLLGIVHSAQSDQAADDDGEDAHRRFMTFYNSLVRQHKPRMGDQSVGHDAVPQQDLYAL